MYTARTTSLGRLKSYHAELTTLYRMALNQRRFERARGIYERRGRVKRAILVREEWAPASGDDLDFDSLFANPS
jgi:hypothetical protein